MQMKLLKAQDRKPITKLSVVRNFRQVIEDRDISLMNKELYKFVTLYCGFIAHYDINGFKATYSHPKDFAEVFIRHFDRNHRYFNGIYPCHEEPYKETGYTKAEIKQEFNRIVDLHKDLTRKWAEQRQKHERHAIYLSLKQEFETKGLNVSCDACGNKYDVKISKEDQDVTDFKHICCSFCGQQIKLH